MGGTACKGTPNSNKAIAIAILGLDNAGKTTTVRVLEKAPVDSVAPTVGYSQSEITHKNEKIKLIDLGGAKTFREAWRHYYDDAYGFVYVLDSSEENRLGENRDVLKRLLQEEKVKGKPILILANKQDKDDALDKNGILEDLKIERLVNENRTLCRVELCTAKSMSSNGKNSKIDESIRLGFDWLIKTVYENYDVLHKRVEEDVQKRNEAEQIAKRERQERVQKLREEREKEEGAEDNKDEDENTMKNGFVPINQAVKNAERNLSEKPTKDKSNENNKSKTTNGSTSFPPLPIPRSTSHTRTLVNDENSDDEELPRRHNSDDSSQRKESPVARSASSNFGENQQTDAMDDPSSTRTAIGKKKKVIGAGRLLSQSDSLPPLAPSSAAARRDDLTQQKRPPVGTPRPQGLVAQWAITSPTPRATTAEKLTTISSDNELDNHDGELKTKPPKPNQRILSPHPSTTNRIIRAKSPQLTALKRDDNSNHANSTNNDSRRSTRQNPNSDEDSNEDDRTTRRSLAVQKSRSRFTNDDDDQADELNDHRRKTNAKDQDRYSKQTHNRNDDDDDDDPDIRSVPSSRALSSSRKTPGGDASHRSQLRTNGNLEDDF